MVILQLSGTFVCRYTDIVHSLLFLYPKSQASGHLLCCAAWLVSDMVRRHKDGFSKNSAYVSDKSLVDSHNFIL